MMRAQTLRMASALSVVLFTAACATSGGATNPDQKIIADYSVEYAATGGIVGGILGCGVGALLSKKNRAAGCAAGGAVGAIAGAGGGLYFARSQGQYAAERGATALDQDVVNAEILKAQQVSAAAERLTASARADIASLNQRIATGQASRQQLVQRVVQINRERIHLEKAAETLRTKIGQVNSDIDKGAYKSADVVWLTQRRDSLRRELARIEHFIQAMEQEAGAAGV